MAEPETNTVVAQVGDDETAGASEQAPSPTLPAPSKELAERATRRVDWSDRFRAHRMAGGAGTVRQDLYSFEEIGRFLMGTDWGQVEDIHAKRSSINWLDMGKLAAWLEDVAGDSDLAEAVRERADDGASALKSQIDAVGPVLAERFGQYQSVLGTDGEGQE